MTSNEKNKKYEFKNYIRVTESAFVIISKFWSHITTVPEYSINIYCNITNA